MKHSPKEILTADFVLTMNNSQQQWRRDIVNFDVTPDGIERRVWQQIVESRICQIPQEVTLLLLRRCAQLKMWPIEDYLICGISNDIFKGSQMAEKAPTRHTEPGGRLTAEEFGIILASLAGNPAFGEAKPQFVTAPQPPSNPEAAAPVVENADGADVHAS